MNPHSTLEIIHEDEQIIAINKPHGLLVHKSNLAKDAEEFALQKLRNQVGHRVYTTHRLDRKTAGALIFAKSKDVQKEINLVFQNKAITKTYLAIVRGYTDDSGNIDYPLTNDKGKVKNAITDYKTLERLEIPVSFGKFSTSRYSLVELKPQPGRYHQLRKHMAHIYHPIIGDRPHGCNKQNRFWKEQFGLREMLLHAYNLEFNFKGESLIIKAPLSNTFKYALNEVLKSQTKFV